MNTRALLLIVSEGFGRNAPRRRGFFGMRGELIHRRASRGAGCGNQIHTRLALSMPQSSPMTAVQAMCPPLKYVGSRSGGR